MIDEKEAFIQRIETLSEIVRNTEMQSRRLFREVERMFEEYRERWPEKTAEGTEQPLQPDTRDEDDNIILLNNGNGY